MSVVKKVLIISYYWPPAGGPGVQRWLKFAKYLPEFGVEPVLYVPENAHYPLKDHSLLREVPEDLEVIRKPILEPYSLARIFSGKKTQKISSGIIQQEQSQSFLEKLMLFIRGNFFIPDARKFWIHPSVNFLEGFLVDRGIDTVITTGPPHSMHLIGLTLKEKLKVTWIADFRDPWTQIGYHDKLRLLPGARKKHEALELQVLQKADKLITTSFTTRSEFQKKTRIPIEVITNGYDRESVGKVERDRKFSIAHIGSLLAGRNPANLWVALRELSLEHKDFASDLQIKLVGAVGDPVVESIRKEGLEKYLWLKGYVSHTEALQLQRSAQLLLLIEIDSEQTKGIIPGKLFEYMVSNRPILAVGPKDADIQEIIRQTNTGEFFLYSQKEEIKKYLLECYKKFRAEGLESHPIGLQKYSRKALTGQLAKLVKD